MNIPPKYEDVAEQLDAALKREAALREELDRVKSRYDREVLGLNNEGDPIGGDPACGYKNELARVNAAFDELAACVGFSEARLDQAGDSPMDCANQLQQRLTVAERDARRYRYLREGAVMHYMSAEGSESKDAYLTITGYGHDDSAASIDNAIDAQMLAALKPAAEGEGS